MVSARRQDSPTPLQPGISSTRFRLSGTDEQGEGNISELRESFRQGFVFELLDLSRPERPIAVHVMVLNPVRYTLTEPFNVTLTPAEDDSVVAEENGIIVREISLEGTYGISEKRARGFVGAQGGGNPLSGADHFQDLRCLFRQYSALKKDPQRAANIQMIFHAIRDDDHFVVTPREFVTPRDASRTRTHYEYRITLAAIAEANFSGLQREREERLGFGDLVLNAVRDIDEAFNDARAGLAEVTANLADIRRRVGNIDAVVNSAVQIVNAVGGFLSGTTALINFPLQLAANVTEALARASDTLVDSVGNIPFNIVSENARSLRRIEAAVDRITQFDDKFQDSIQRVEDLFAGERNILASDINDLRSGAEGSAPGPGGATNGSRVRNAAGAEGREAGLVVPRGTGLRGYVIARTDSIESIATVTDTTPEAIIILNDLRPPYITAAGGPGILKPGDIILVPANTGGGGGSARGVNDFLSSEEALYGIDIALDPIELERAGRFELLVNETSDTEDAELARGIANVVQGTEITIGTEIGTTVFLPEIGIRRNIGSRGTTQHVLLASITLREALLQDTRVSQIESSRVVFDSTTGELTQEITPVVSGQASSATFVLPFGRATGGGGM